MFYMAQLIFLPIKTVYLFQSKENKAYCIFITYITLKKYISWILLQCFALFFSLVYLYIAK